MELFEIASPARTTVVSRSLPVSITCSSSMVTTGCCYLAPPKASSPCRALGPGSCSRSCANSSPTLANDDGIQPHGRGDRRAIRTSIPGVDARAEEVLRIAGEGGSVGVDGALEFFAPRGVAVAEVFEEPHAALGAAGGAEELAGL